MALANYLIILQTSNTRIMKMSHFSGILSLYSLNNLTLRRSDRGFHMLLSDRLVYRVFFFLIIIILHQTRF